MTTRRSLWMTCIILATFTTFGCDSDADDNETPTAGATPAGAEVAGDEMSAGAPAGAEVAGDEMIAGTPAGAEVAGDEMVAGAPAGAEVAGDEMIAGAPAGVEVAGDETPAGTSAGAEVAGDEMIAGEMPAGEMPAGEMTGGEGIIIEVAGEDGEEWVDPEDFGAPGEGVHAFTMTDINGEEVDMRRYRGRVILAVNVASRCGYTRQYEDLQTLYEMYRERGLVILGFPANNFGNQEPGTDEEIAEFCSANYGVNFPMFSKISVLGADIHPLYQYLTGESGRDVSWNFNKFLVDPDGLYVAQFLQTTEPLSDEMINALEPLLDEE